MKKKSSDPLSFNFDFSSLTFGPGNHDDEYTEIPRLNMEPVCFENAEAMADAIDYSKDYFCLASGSFIFGDFLEALCFKKDLQPKSLYITTLGMSEDNIDSIVNIVDYLGGQEVNLIVSHYFAGVERHKLIPYMEREFSGKPINVAVLASHCKIAVFLSDKGDCVIAGSANLSSSNNVEQFIIMHNPAIVKYCKSRLDNVMERFTVIRGMEGARMDWKVNRKNTGKLAYQAMVEG